MFVADVFCGGTVDLSGLDAFFDIFLCVDGVSDEFETAGAEICDTDAVCSLEIVGLIMPVDIDDTGLVLEDIGLVLEDIGLVPEVIGLVPLVIGESD